MQRIQNVWAGLDKGRQVVAVLALLAILASIFSLARMATSSSMQLLYAGLENGAAGDVILALDQLGATYDVRGSSIYVEARSRDQLRMTLAADGLPANGSLGYELLDSLTGFGTTSQMFDAAYWRAKEGELARTIVASPYISQARVHIANTGSNPFRRSVEATASVTVTTNGSPVNASQAKALRYLVASAVAGLSVENVAVIDSNGSLVGSQENLPVPAAEYDRAQTLKERVLRLMEARVGQGNAVVEVSVDTVTQTETIKERRIDPESRVAISTELEESSDRSSNPSGQVTVASNLPEGDAGSTERDSSQASETRELINYEVSETEHEILRAPGEIKRLSVAVLVDGVQDLDEEGKSIYRDRSEDELSALGELIASAVGFDESRGDVITIKSMDLPSAEASGTSAAAAWMTLPHFDVMSVIQLTVLAFVAIVLGLFVLRPLLSGPPSLGPTTRKSLPNSAPSTSKQTSSEPVLTGEIDDGSNIYLRTELERPAASGARSEAAVKQLAEHTNSPVERLRSLIGERQEETVEILRNWLEDKEENA